MRLRKTATTPTKWNARPVEPVQGAASSLEQSNRSRIMNSSNLSKNVALKKERRRPHG